MTSDIRFDRDLRNTRVLSSNCKRANEPGLYRAKRDVLPVEAGLLLHLALSANFQGYLQSHRSHTARKRTHGRLLAKISMRINAIRARF